MRPTSTMPEWAPALHRVSRLSSRELQVFRLLADGASNAEIADELVVTERTVRAHTGSILSKLELQSRLKVCLTAFAYTQRLALKPMGAGPQAGQSGVITARKEVNEMKKFYEAPALIERGAFAAATAGFGRLLADQLVGRLIP
ncbi:Response regulator containing a CheY-like receiver domain and an HTH DNA-binding domain [Streptomyces sp. Amel2xC10]|nr:Response regulator containing a CheY-like receiver domain and an HTH DNA-binding domain [Streptomyces sp. Amel2xC10]